MKCGGFKQCLTSKHEFLRTEEVNHARLFSVLSFHTSCILEYKRVLNSFKLNDMKKHGITHGGNANAFWHIHKYILVIVLFTNNVRLIINIQYCMLIFLFGWFSFYFSWRA